MSLQGFKLDTSLFLPFSEVIPGSANHFGSAVWKLVFQILEKVEIADQIGILGIGINILQGPHFLT